MDVPLYGRALWTYKWLLLVGVVVALAAAFLSGFNLQGGKIESRAKLSYTASTTVLLTSEQSSLFRSENPGYTLTAGEAPPQLRDLSSTAAVYAYLASGDIIRSATQARVGSFASGESLTALQRTTQPPSSDTTGGRLTLPVISIVGTATSAARSQQISQGAALAFEAYVAGQQDVTKVPAAQRVLLVTLNKGPAVLGQGTNPYVGVVVVGAGVFAVFIAFIFVLYNRRLRRGAFESDEEAARKHEFIDPVQPTTTRLPAQLGDQDHGHARVDVGHDVV